MHSISFRRASDLHWRSTAAEVGAGLSRRLITINNGSNRPQVSQPALSLETAAGAAYRLDESLMERMMLPSMPGIQAIPTSHLNLQRRMHPEIADLMRATLYPYLEVRLALTL